MTNGEVLVVAESIDEQLADISRELISAGLEAKDQIRGTLTVLLCCVEASKQYEIVNCQGVDSVICVNLERSDNYSEANAKVLEKLIEERAPKIVLAPHSVNGYAYGPLAASRLGAAFASDIISVDCTNGIVKAVRSIYENRVQMEISFPDSGLVFMLVRGAVYEKAELGGAAEKVEFSISDFTRDMRSEHLEFIPAPVSDIDITKSEFILSIGRGIGDEENVARFSRLAEKLGATLGCSRPLADAGWLPKPHQVGLSGKMAASCKIYLALGISGAVQHLHGMKHVDTIIAVNIDPSAPIFNVAKYGICGDVFEFADALEQIF